MAIDTQLNNTECIMHSEYMSYDRRMLHTNFPILKRTARSTDIQQRLASSPGFSPHLSYLYQQPNFHFSVSQRSFHINCYSQQKDIVESLHIVSEETEPRKWSGNISCSQQGLCLQRPSRKSHSSAAAQSAPQAGLALEPTESIRLSKITLWLSKIHMRTRVLWSSKLFNLNL